MTKFLQSMAIALLLAACGNGGNEREAQQAKSATEDATAALLAIADDYQALELGYNPLIAYFTGLPTDDHASLPDISPPGIADYVAGQEALLARLDGMDADFSLGTPEWVLFGALREELAASLGERVCRRELWSVNHMGGFYSSLSRIAERQPVTSDAERQATLVRWANIAVYVDRDIANLRAGVAEGYLSPRRAVDRVIRQVSALIDLSPENSPLYAPGRRAGDEAFAAALADVVEGETLPALIRYRDFLRDEYRDAARMDRAVSANPDGVACYEALYRGYTTLSRTAGEIHAIGRAAVEANTRTVRALGMEHYGTDDFTEIIRLVNEDPANQLTGIDHYQQIAEAVVARARVATANVFPAMPTAEMVVEAYPEHLLGTGVSASYQRAVAGEPAKYRFDPTTWEDGTISGVERTAVHEGYPGHHMQIALSQDREQLHDVETLLGNSAYTEGWARYSEALAEELGIYSSHHALIDRRAWPARGMVADTGMHVLGWDDARVKAYLMQSGRAESWAENMMDRMSVIPAQLTAYDSGGLKIFEMRARMEAEQGEAFDLAQFHQRFLENGIIPIGMAEAYIEAGLE